MAADVFQGSAVPALGEQGEAVVFCQSFWFALLWVAHPQDLFANGVDKAILDRET